MTRLNDDVQRAELRLAICVAFDLGAPLFAALENDLAMLRSRPLAGRDARGPRLEHGKNHSFKTLQEKVSGAKSDRKQLARVIGRLGKDDVLVVTRHDRLARSTRDLLDVLGAVADKGAGFKSLRDTWADTTTPHGS